VDRGTEKCTDLREETRNLICFVEEEEEVMDVLFNYSGLRIVRGVGAERRLLVSLHDATRLTGVKVSPASNNGTRLARQTPNTSDLSDTFAARQFATQTNNITGPRHESLLIFKIHRLPKWKRIWIVRVHWSLQLEHKLTMAQWTLPSATQRIVLFMTR
jgi:hypothetical protein